MQEAWKAYIDSLSSEAKTQLIKAMVEATLPLGMDADFSFWDYEPGDDEELERQPGFYWIATGEPLLDDDAILDDEPSVPVHVHANYGYTESMGDYARTVFFQHKDELDEFIKARDAGK